MIIINVINVVNVCCNIYVDSAIVFDPLMLKVITFSVFRCTFNNFYQYDDQFLELVPLSDVSDDVAARRVRTPIQDKDVRPLILQRRKEGTEIKEIIGYNRRQG
jgi:hypothetical protein